MPALLNPKHERFAQELAKGLSATEAYEAAGYKPNRGNAAALKQQQSISMRVIELQQSAAEDAEAARREAVLADGITMAAHLSRLDKLSRAAELAKDFTAAVKAERSRGEAAGFYVQRVESTNRNFVIGATPEPMSADEWSSKHRPN